MRSDIERFDILKVLLCGVVSIDSPVDSCARYKTHEARSSILSTSQSILPDITVNLAFSTVTVLLLQF